MRRNKLLRLPGAARNLGLRGSQIPAWQPSPSCAVVPAVRHGSHEQHKDHEAISSLRSIQPCYNHKAPEFD